MNKRRNARVVEWGALEKHCIILIVPRVRIPLSPPRKKEKAKWTGFCREEKAGAMSEFVQSTRRTPRGGVEEIFRQENYP